MQHIGMTKAKRTAMKDIVSSGEFEQNYVYIESKVLMYCKYTQKPLRINTIN